MKLLRFILTIAIPLIVFLLIMNSVVNKKTIELDSLVYKKVSEFITPNLTDFMKLISFFGSGQFFIVFSIALIIIFYKYEKNSFFSSMIVINLFSSSIINTSIKQLIRRDRPNILRLIEILGYSFPSGHSMVSMSFYGLLMFICFRRIKNNFKYLIILLFLILVLVIGLSRIYLGVHYFSDVIGGFSLGVLWVGIFSIIIDIRYKKINKKLNAGETKH